MAGDLFTQVGGGPAITTDDIVEPALVAEEIFHSTALGANVPPTLARLAALEPTTLATMHGSSFRGDGAAQLRALALGLETFVVDAAA